MHQITLFSPARLRLYKPAWFLILPVFLTGCSLVTPVSKPDINSTTTTEWQAQLPAGVADNASEQNRSEAGWWQQIHDPLLQQLMQLTLQNSTDMESARLTYRSAQLTAEIAGVDNLPSLNFSTGVTRANSNQQQVMSTSYSGRLSASWEIDLWGSASSEKRAAQAGIAKAESELHGAQVSLMAQTANAYIDLRLAQENLRVANASVDIRKESYDLARFEYQSGMSTELEVMQAKTLLDRAKAELPQYYREQEVAINQLRALSGGKINSLLPALHEAANLPQPPQSFAIGIPAETLRQRPDVKAQEYAVLQSAEAVNQARKARFPSFTLTGTLSDSGDNYADVFDAESVVRSIAASLSYALFDNGVLKNNELSRSIELDQSLNTYRSTILTAQQEVENALTSLSSAQQQQESYQQAENSAQLAEELARFQYDAGMLDFTDLLDTQSSLLEAQSSTVQNRGAILTAWVELYRSAGGGWQQLNQNTDSNGTTSAITEAADQGKESE